MDFKEILTYFVGDKKIDTSEAEEIKKNLKTIVDSIGRRVITMDQGRIVRDDKQGKYVL